MTTIEREAKKFSKQLYSDGVVFYVDKTKDKLDQKLKMLYRNEDRLAFLRILREESISDINTHRQTCTRDDCQFMQNKDAGLFLYDQEIERLNASYQYTPPDNDKFTPKEESEMHVKINSILERLEKLGLGQEVIYEEIESLKNHFNLGKKTWFQLLSGKLVSVGVDKTIEELIFKDPIRYLAQKLDEL